MADQWGRQIVAALKGGGLDSTAPGGSATLGHVPGVVAKTVSSVNFSVVTDPEDVWTHTGLYTGQIDPFSGSTIQISSNNTNDDVSGTGAQAVRIEGLDGDKSLQIEVFEMQGTGLVTSTSLWYRVHNVTVVGENVNIGKIQVVETSFSNIFAIINPSAVVGNMAGFTVPAEKSVIISDYSITGGNSDGIGFFEGSLIARKPGGIYQTLDRFELNISTGQFKKSVLGVLLSELVDVIVRIERSNIDSSFSASINFLETDNSLIDPENANYIL